MKLFQENSSYRFSNVRVKEANKNFECINNQGLELMPSKDFKVNSEQCVDNENDEMIILCDTASAATNTTNMDASKFSVK